MNAINPALQSAQAVSVYNRGYDWDIIPRDNLNFKLLDETIPKYWFAGDAFKTRFIEAVMAGFPEGEKFFISSLRLFKDQITDPQLIQDVKDFTRQEAQHGIAHMVFNDKLAKEGMPVKKLIEIEKQFLQMMLDKLPAKYCVAHTAAIEHITALLAEGFFDKKTIMQDVHPHLRALLAWHSIEEMEHKAVAFDVMQQVAKVNYPTRAGAMIVAISLFSLFSMVDANRFLKADGYDKITRVKMIAKGINFLYGKKGIVRPLAKNLFAYLKPNFHPVQIAHVHNYPAWLAAYAQTNDPLVAGEAFYQAAHDA